jgi:RNA polymerase sigma factor (sigma-70 family)
MPPVTDPLRDPETLLRGVYGYVAYRIGPGPEAEDIVGTAFERAVRYRASYDPGRGEPLPWLIGIARRCLHDALSAVPPSHAGHPAPLLDASDDLEESVVRRLMLFGALARLNDRDREIVALRYGADLSARTIAGLLGMRTNAVEVALLRALRRLRHQLDPDPARPGPRAAASRTGRATVPRPEP